MESAESKNIRERYSRRTEKAHLYSDADPYYRESRREYEQAIRTWSEQTFPGGLRETRVMEVGCGHGKNLRLFLDLGCRPENLAGCDLLESRASHARSEMPPECRIVAGDACELDWPDEDFDVVFVATVFSSILDKSMRIRLAARMWELTRPGGGVLWYDFVYNNPNNPDVAGVPLKSVRELFPVAPAVVRRLTLAPPLGRRLARIHPVLHSAFNTLPFLRTHVLCWIQKP